MKSPRLSRKQYDLVIAAHVDGAWIELAVPRGKGTLEEIAYAKKLLADYERFLKTDRGEEAT